jgi:hypothetical protein
MPRSLHWAGATHECGAEDALAIVPRYPIESVATVELRSLESESWVAQSDVIATINKAAGIVHFASPLGIYPARLRLTYTGGYWYDTNEAETGTLPTGATQVPAELKFAWLLQCARIWGSIDALGAGLQGTEASQQIQTRLAAIDWVPQVAAVLRAYRRMLIL